MKRFFLVGALAGLTTLSFAADRTGLAQASSEFSINREGSVLIQTANRVAAVREGDQIVTESEPVTVEAGDNMAWMAGPNSKITLGENHQVALENGTLAVAAKSDAPSNVKYLNLLVEAPAVEKTDNGRNIFVMKSEPGNSVRVEAVSGSLAIKHAETGEQIAWVSEGDTMMFVQEGEGWRPAAAGHGAPVQIFRSQVTDPGVVQDSAVEDDDDDDKAIWWWVGGAGAAAATTAWIWYEHEDDEEDNKDRRDKEEERNLPSPIRPIFD